MPLPKHVWTDRFHKDWKKLTGADKARFKDAMHQFDEDFAQPGRKFRPGLRVKPIKDKRQGANKGVWEMTWEKHDGRATFQYDANNEIVWRRIGDHSVLDNP